MALLFGHGVCACRGRLLLCELCVERRFAGACVTPIDVAFAGSCCKRLPRPVSCYLAGVRSTRSSGNCGYHRAVIAYSCASLLRSVLSSSGRGIHGSICPRGASYYCHCPDFGCLQRLSARREKVAI